MKNVCVLSTHALAVNDIVKKHDGSDKVRPQGIANYNKNMGGVDSMDRKIYQIAAERASKRYWIKMFSNLIDLSIRNSYELYTTLTLTSLH